MRHHLMGAVQPQRPPSLFPFESGLGIGFTRKATIAQMPAFLLPLGLDTLDLALQTGLRPLL
ncbi:MAG TPA: hypothetical protein VGF67_28980 [Ktedonobacteraceae bacterium]